MVQFVLTRVAPICMVFAFSLVGLSADDEAYDAEAYVGTIDIQPCSYWRMARFDDGRTGYVCNFRPFRETVADGRDTQNAIADLERRVTLLEQEILAMREVLLNR